MRILKEISFSLLGVVLLAVSGCGDASPAQDEQNQTQPKQGKESIRVISPLNPQIKSSESIAIVNGVPIHRSDYDRWILLRARDYCAVNGLDISKRSGKLDGYILSTREVALADLIRRELIRQECEKRHITVSNDVLVAVQRRFMKRIRHPNESFDAYVGKLPEEEGEELRKQVFCDARDEVFLRNWVTNDIEYVSATEVSNHIASVQHYNERVVALNSESKKRAAAAKAEILAGASFYEVATNRTDIFLEDARFWDVVEIGEFEPDEDIFKFLASAKAGDISDPLDLDDGIGIVGVLQKEQEKQEDGTVSDLYTLVRCMFNGYDAIEESDDVESVRKLLLERKMNDAKQALLTELFATAKIEYPFGNKLFLKKKVKRTKKPPQKAARPNKKQPEVKPVPRGAKPVSAKGGVPTKRTVPAKGM